MIKKKPSGKALPEGFTMASERCPETHEVHIKDIVLQEPLKVNPRLSAHLLTDLVMDINKSTKGI